MVFSSTVFLFFYLPIVLLIYYMTPLKWRNAVLLLFNLVFYGWGEPVYVFLMIASTVIDYFFGLMIARNSENRILAKRFLISSILINVGTLFVFKYLDFTLLTLQKIPMLSNLKPIGLVLPIGISFYTFQKMSYVIDVYRGDASVQKHFVPFATYVTLFPQLIAGPIVKYKDVDRQLTGRSHHFANFAAGVPIFTVGLAKKVLLANSIGLLWDTYLAGNMNQISVIGAWMAALAFTFQIYFDFSGYSDMAIGLGRMFGFEFMKNFNYPYRSISVTDFWRRWHISLGTWFREYVYIPLGGNRKGKKRWFLNILIVWAATGIWHGASWNFLIWGLYYAIILILEKRLIGRVLDRCYTVVRILYTMLVVVVGWVIFGAPTLSGCGTLLRAMFGVGSGLLQATDLYYLRSYGILFLVMAIASTPAVAKLFQRIPENVGKICTLVLTLAGLVFSTAAIVNASYNPFLYFRF